MGEVQELRDRVTKLEDSVNDIKLSVGLQEQLNKIMDQRQADMSKKVTEMYNLLIKASGAKWMLLLFISVLMYIISKADVLFHWVRG